MCSRQLTSAVPASTAAIPPRRAGAAPRGPATSANTTAQPPATIAISATGKGCQGACGRAMAARAGACGRERPVAPFPEARTGPRGRAAAELDAGIGAGADAGLGAAAWAEAAAGDFGAVLAERGRRLRAATGGQAKLAPMRPSPEASQHRAALCSWRSREPIVHVAHRPNERRGPLAARRRAGAATVGLTPRRRTACGNPAGLPTPRAAHCKASP